MGAQPLGLVVTYYPVSKIRTVLYVVDAVTVVRFTGLGPGGEIGLRSPHHWHSVVHRKRNVTGIRPTSYFMQRHAIMWRAGPLPRNPT
jgi:hypothetical protein